MNILKNASRIACLVGAFSAYCFGISPKNVQDMLKEFGVEDEIKVESIIDSPAKNLSFVIVERQGFQTLFLAHNESNMLIMLSNENLITSDKKFSAEFEKIAKKISENNKNVTDKTLLNLFERFKDGVLEIKGAKSGKTAYMVLDINCPYCKNEVEKIDSYLKEGDVRVWIVGILSMDSARKAAQFHNGLKEAMSNEQKIAYLKKAFDKSFKVDENISVNRAMEMAVHLGLANIRGVPYIIKR